MAFRKFTDGLRSLFRKTEVDREIDDEVKGFIDDAAREKMKRGMSREEALRSYTWNNAYAAFEENVKGSLEPGKLADITVLSKDILTVPEDQIPATDVKYTIVGGKVMFQQ